MWVYTLFFVVTIVFSAILHEYAHGWMADQLGDPTAKYAGRLTLDPRVHIDPVGSILLPLLFVLLPGGFMFAYAKPVPFNPYNLKDQKWGPAFVGLAGPLTNLLLATAGALVFRLVPATSVFSAFVFIIVQANVALAIFNLMPIPPLDGSKLLIALLPHRWHQVQLVLQQYGFILVLIFALFFSALLSPLIHGLISLLTGLRF